MDSKTIAIKESSGNVFKDIGLPNAEELLAKAELIEKINSIIEDRKLTQTEAAEILGIPQPQVSLLNKGIVSGISLGKLVILLNKLNRDVDIVIHEKEKVYTTTKKRNMYGHLQVISA